MATPSDDIDLENEVGENREPNQRTDPAKPRITEAQCHESRLSIEKKCNLQKIMLHIFTLPAKKQQVRLWKERPCDTWAPQARMKNLPHCQDLASPHARRHNPSASCSNDLETPLYQRCLTYPYIIHMFDVSKRHGLNHHQSSPFPTAEPVTFRKGIHRHYSPAKHSGKPDLVRSGALKTHQGPTVRHSATL